MFGVDVIDTAKLSLIPSEARTKRAEEHNATDDEDVNELDEDNIDVGIDDIDTAMTDEVEHGVTPKIQRVSAHKYHRMYMKHHIRIRSYYTVAGILSFYPRSDNKVKVYTKIQKYNGWILETIGEGDERLEVLYLLSASERQLSGAKLS
uniref:Uncharacterized protein n=1 Tax=Glossina pallidipes TaxID=7398 RepID=A0A1B0AIQ7_GLOPL